MFYMAFTDPVTILLTNGFFLSFLLFILLIVLSSKNNGKHPAKKRSRVKDDLKKIKDQIAIE